MKYEALFSRERHHLSPSHDANIFCPENTVCLSAYYICCVYSNALQTNSITEANTMNPDQTAPKGAV